MALDTQEQRQDFMRNLYAKHADYITEIKKELVTDLDPASVEREGKFKNTDSCCGNGCGHCEEEDDWNLTEESMKKAFELTFEKDADGKIIL